MWIVCTMLNIFNPNSYLSQRNHFAAAWWTNEYYRFCRDYCGIRITGNPCMVCGLSNLEKGEQTSEWWGYGGCTSPLSSSFLPSLLAKLNYVLKPITYLMWVLLCITYPDRTQAYGVFICLSLCAWAVWLLRWRHISLFVICFSYDCCAGVLFFSLELHARSLLKSVPLKISAHMRMDCTCRLWNIFSFFR